jgi:hypothetical protein
MLGPSTDIGLLNTSEDNLHTTRVNKFNIIQQRCIKSYHL